MKWPFDFLSDQYDAGYYLDLRVGSNDGSKPSIPVQTSSIVPLLAHALIYPTFDTGNTNSARD
jgi:hypothetical protein